jgi:hypothetical protein
MGVGSLIELGLDRLTEISASARRLHQQPITIAEAHAHTRLPDILRTIHLNLRPGANVLGAVGADSAERLDDTVHRRDAMPGNERLPAAAAELFIGHLLKPEAHVTT